MASAEKKKEDLSALLKTTGVLRSKFGRLHIQFGQALSIKTYAEKNGLPLDTSNPNAWNEKVPRLGFEILRRIADVCTVTPTAVVSSVLLSHQGRGIGLSKLVELGTELIEFFAQRGFLVFSLIASIVLCICTAFLCPLGSSLRCSTAKRPVKDSLEPSSPANLQE